MCSKKVLSYYVIASLACISSEFALAKPKSQTDLGSLKLYDLEVRGPSALESDISPHDKSMKTLILAHEEKNAVLKNIDKVLEEKNKAIFEYMKLTKSLNSKIKDLSLTQRVKGEFKKRELSSNIGDQDQKISDLKGLIVQKDLKIQFLKKSIKNQNTQLTQKIHKLNFKIKNLTDSFNKMPEDIEKMAILTQSKHIEEIRGLQNQLHAKRMEVIAYQDQIKKYEGLSDIDKMNSQLAMELKNSNKSLEEYKISYKELQVKYNNEVSKNKELRTYAQNIKEEYSNHIQILQEKYSTAINKIDQVEDEYRNKKSRMPASATSYEPVPVDIDLGYLVEVDPRHLKVILDENFFFQSGETSMNEESKKSLQSIISAYSREIFSKDELKDRLENIHIIGHASPVYNGKFVSPQSATRDAYQINMDISLARAKSVASVIIDENFELPNRSEIRQRLVISGKSFSEPRLLQRGPASSAIESCEIYDCNGSQRVEIIFELQKKN